MKVLDNKLAEGDWLMGGRFTVSDLNVASVMGPLRPVKFDFEPFPNVAKWFLACSSRPAAAKARELQMAQVD
jgi:glutathione S-transferase